MPVRPAEIAVFTDHGDPRNFQPWRRTVHPPVRGGRIGASALQAWRLWRAANCFGGVGAYVTYGSMAAFMLAGLQWLFSAWREPRTHVMFDLLLEKRRGGAAGLYDRLKAAAFRGGRVRAVAWGVGDPDTFAAEHGLPRDRLQFHPYHTTLDGFTWEERDDGYVFAGGNNGRDYRTVIDALRDVGCRAVIATTDPAIPPLAAGCPRIEVRGVTPAEFRQLLAGCTVLVEAHPPGFPRTAGHQTLLNAMAMGKPIAMADRRSAPGYLDDGVEGLVVDAGDAEALAGAVRRLLADADLRRACGEAGRRRLVDPIYRTANHMQSIYNLALRWEFARVAPGRDPVLIEEYGPAAAGARPEAQPS